MPWTNSRLARAGRIEMPRFGVMLKREKTAACLPAAGFPADRKPAHGSRVDRRSVRRPRLYKRIAGCPPAAENLAMPTGKSADANDHLTQAGALLELQRRLEADRGRLLQQIGDYPQPIPACDAQFNHLLAERARLSADLQRVAELIGKDRLDHSDADSIRRLIDNVRRIDSRAADKLTAALQIDADRRYARQK